MSLASAARWRSSIRTKVMLLLSALVLFMMGTVAMVVLERERSRTFDHIRQLGIETADVLATSCLVCLLRDDVTLIAEVAESVRYRPRASGEAPELRYIVVMDAYGNTLYAWGNDTLEPRHDRILAANAFRDPGQNRVDRVASTAGEEILDVASKIALTGVDGVTEVFGTCRVGLSLDRVRRQVARLTLWIFGGLVLFTAAGVGLAYLFTKRPLDSLHRLSRQIGRIASGDFRQRVPVQSRDEIGRLCEAVNSMAEDLEKRELLKRYISRTAWEDIEQRGSAGFERDEGLQKVTILFMDIRNFTSLAESRHTHEVVELLNEIFSLMVAVIDTHGGVVDKFIGDALLVVFYPEETDDDALRAVYCAAEMQERLSQFNRNRAFYGREAIRIGVGINSGDVITGSIGSEHRKDYTVIGDPVNVASRLQELSKEARHTGVVLSETTFRQVQSLVVVADLETREIRGKQEPVRCYELVQVRELDEIFQKIRSDHLGERTDAFRSLEAHHGPETVEAMVQLLDESDQDLILRAVMVLGRIGRGDVRVARLLARIIATTPNERLQATAIKAIVRVEAFEDLEGIVPFLEHSDARVRANTIEALDHAGQGRYTDRIARLIADPAPRVKANAAVALWKRGRFDVIDSLRQLIGRSDPKGRAAAAFAAGEIFKVSVLPLAAEAASVAEARRELGRLLDHVRDLTAMLVELLRDDDPSVVATATLALVRTRDARALEPLLALVSAGDPAGAVRALDAMERIGAPLQVLRCLDRLRQLLRGGTPLDPN